jgi:carbonic anhydrase
MQKLVRGVQHFRDHVYPARQEMYRTLADGQNPHTLFITCSDSRLDPDVLTQSSPGNIFVLRNAGNLVPPYGAAHGGEAATVEYAVAGLGVRHIVVCGHSCCGAMKALLQPPAADELPETVNWLRYAEATRHVVRTKYATVLDFDERWLATVEENVLIQLDHLRTHPTVAAGLAAGTLLLYGWVFDLEHGQFRNYDPELGQFAQLPAADQDSADLPPAYPYRAVTARPRHRDGARDGNGVAADGPRLARA